MRTKKLFSLLLVVLMLCSLSVSAFAAETAQASVPVVLTVVNSVSPISVSVPAARRTARLPRRSDCKATAPASIFAPILVLYLLCSQ